MYGAIMIPGVTCFDGRTGWAMLILPVETNISAASESRRSGPSRAVE